MLYFFFKVFLSFGNRIKVILFIDNLDLVKNK